MKHDRPDERACEFLHEHLDAYLGGSLAPGLVRAIEAHVAGCEECATVVALLAADPPTPSLALDVVARTTGRTCRRVREEFAAWIDADEVDAEDGPEHQHPAPRAHVHEHLAECASCRAVLSTLTWTQQRLPRLAELEVDADFTADVLMATLPRPSLAHVFALRVRERFAHWLDRPMVAQEFAFAITVVLVLLTATPWSPWPGLPARALEFVQFVPSARAGEASGDGEQWSLVQALPPLRYAESAREDLREALEPRVDRVARDLEWVGAGLGAAGHGVAAGDKETVIDGLHVIGCGLTNLWIGLRVPTAPVDDACTDVRSKIRDEDEVGNPGGSR